ncbi:amyloid-beta-like protein isoform X7 [Haematobia irritans]|uniref:amyloid-beta-like protein isoform X7 n=1 Tax=Haematobia irritans TaxID=7368 RepID=UPI003F5097E4
MSRILAWGLMVLMAITATSQVQAASPRWEPQIAVLCEAGQVYQPQYLSEEGRWVTDLNKKSTGATCLRDKLDLLDYCKKAYPNRDITNIVESSHYQKIGGWCRQGALNANKCKGAHRWIKPFRCLADEIRVKKTDLPVMPPVEMANPLSDDLDDISSDDNDSNYSKDTADDVEDEDDEDDLLADDEEDEMAADEATATGDDVNAEYDSGEDNYEEDAVDSYDQQGSSSGAKPSNKPNSKDEKSSGSLLDGGAGGKSSSSNNNNGDLPMPPTTGQPTPDPYFTHFDPHYEHQSYKVSQKEAQQRLEESHREKVTRVMKDWSDLEEKYQDMRLADPKAAQSFKQRMTARFQTSVQALEEEGNAEKHQLAAMHQQRVLAHINQRKREAMTCYTQALTEQPPNAHHVEKCLQKLLRALHKDRAHALAHYRHLLNSGGAGGLEAAASERPRTLERLIDIDRAVNQSMTMLKRYPELSNKISQLMNDYILALRSKDDIPGSSLGMSEEAEAAILDKYRIEIERKVAEKERLRLAEKQRKEQRAAEREKLREEKLRLEAKKVDDMVKAEQDSQAFTSEESKTSKDESMVDPTKMAHSDKDSAAEEYVEATLSTKTQTILPTVDDEAVQRAVEDVAAAVAHQEAEPSVQHFMSHDLGHRESSFSLRREFSHSSSAHANKEGRNVYFTLSFAGIALMAAIFVGIAVAKWRTARSPHAQGFIEVDQNAAAHHPVVPEEKIVPSMQINGYENPTYKYFEVKE